MPDLATVPPARRSDLLFRVQGEQGQYVVKDPRTGQFFTIGDEEFFLLWRLDGERTAEALCAAYEACFGKPLALADLDEFTALVRAWGFLKADDRAGAGPAPAPGPPPAGAAGVEAEPRRSLLYWRVSLFNPDRLFDRVEPRIRFFWTRGFLLLSAGCVVTAAAVAWLNRRELVGQF